ncbi:MAG TPA: peptidoglycan-binding domain-containing protein [Terracidiphilus sp.]
MAAPAFAASKSTHRSASATTHTRTARLHTKGKAKSHKLHGQQAIDSERVSEIQQALIREHYMTGETNGQWDSTTQAAMRKYQSDQGWQTRLMPDSRALVKLGLGPDYSTAINAKDVASASPSAPPAPATNGTPAGETAGFTAASGVNR